MIETKKRYEVTKYGFGEMKVGDERSIEVSGPGTRYIYDRLKSACRAETKRHSTVWKTWKTENHIHYKRLADPEPTEQ